LENVNLGDREGEGRMDVRGIALRGREVDETVV
jgi:hypothetical protein